MHQPIYSRHDKTISQFRSSHSFQPPSVLSAPSPAMFLYLPNPSPHEAPISRTNNFQIPIGFSSALRPPSPSQHQRPHHLLRNHNLHQSPRRKRLHLTHILREPPYRTHHSGVGNCGTWDGFCCCSITTMLALHLLEGALRHFDGRFGIFD